MCVSKLFTVFPAHSFRQAENIFCKYALELTKEEQTLAEEYKTTIGFCPLIDLVCMLFKTVGISIISSMRLTISDIKMGIYL